jgi:hypothetical protein
MNLLIRICDFLNPSISMHSLGAGLALSHIERMGCYEMSQEHSASCILVRFCLGSAGLKATQTRHLKQYEPNSWPHSSVGSNNSITRYISAIGIPYFVTMYKISIFFFHILTFHNSCSSPSIGLLPSHLYDVSSVQGIGCLYFAVYVVPLPCKYLCHRNILLHIVHKHFGLFLLHAFYFASDSTFSATVSKNIFLTIAIEIFLL